MPKLLLVSSSSTHGTGFLEHCEEAIRQRFEGRGRVLFVPFALADRDKYTDVARQRFQQLGLTLDSLHQAKDAVRAVRDAEAIFVGGGNTFRLLKALYDLQLMTVLRSVVGGGTPYMGSSAGTNLACPTVRTTNDMPIVEPPSLTALGVVPFQINPHYLDPDPQSKHQGETRETRIREFLEDNETPVVGIREGSWLWADDGQITLQGSTGGVLFRRGLEAIPLQPGDDIGKRIGNEIKTAKDG